MGEVVAEEVAPAGEEDVLGFLRRFLARIEVLGFSGLCFGIGVVVFPEGEGFAGEAREGVDEAGELFGVGLGVFGIGVGAEAHELIDHLGGGHAQARFVEGGRVGGRQEVCGELGTAGDVFEPFTLAKPILVTALFVFTEMTWLEFFALVAEAFDDVRVGKAIENPLIDLIAEGFGEAGDLAFAAMRKSWRLRYGGVGFRRLGRLGREGQDLGLRIHSLKMKSNLVGFGRLGWGELGPQRPKFETADGKGWELDGRNGKNRNNGRNGMLTRMPSPAPKNPSIERSGH